MNCPVPGCPANNEGKLYGGQPVCMQPFSGDPEAFKESTKGCCMRSPQSNQPQIDVREYVKNL